VTVGPYPVLLIHLAEKQGLDNAVDIMKAGMESAQRLVMEGKAVGIGEIGRPHFPVPPEINEASNQIMSYGMQLAKEARCPVVLHTESATSENMSEMAMMADRVGLRRDKVVKHYCPPLVLEEENSGLFPSVLAKKEQTIEALRKGSRFLLETDYLDDLRRPGAVLSITTVPKRTITLMQSGQMTEEQAYKIHVDNPLEVYGIKVRA
jgi:TatD-related deoxyribonuclease